MSQQTSENLVHPADFCQDEWHVAQNLIDGDNLIAYHDLVPPGEFYIPPSTHHAVLFFLSDGKRQVNRIDGKEYDGVFPAGDFVVKPAEHECFNCWETTDESLLLLIKPTFVDRIVKETEAVNSNRLELRPILRKYDPQIEYFCRAFLKEMQNQNIGGRIYLESLANLLVVNLLRHHSTSEAKIKEIEDGISAAQKQEVIDYIQAYLDRPISLKEMSQIANLSAFHFIRQFKKAVGLTPHQYVMQQRIELARSLLKQKKLSIADVALDCGFSNQSHLGRVFKRYTGMTPKQYRQSF